MELIAIIGNPVKAFESKQSLESILQAIEKQALLLIENLSIDDPKDRKEFASVAYKVAQSKTAIDNAGKQLVADWKQKSKLVDESRKQARDFLDNLKDIVRKPLTDYENAESEKKRLEEERKRLEEEERQRKIKEEEDRKLKELQEQLAKQQVEIERQKAEIAAKEEAERQKQREEQLKREAEEKAKRDAEEVIRKAEVEKLLAIEREKKAKADRLQAIEEAKLREARLLKEAEERQKIAIENERLRQEAEKKRIEEEERKKRENDQLMLNLMSQTIDDLVLLGCDNELANKIIQAIYTNSIRNISFNV